MKILVAMDTSSASQAALEAVAARPWPEGSTFDVVSVVEPSHLWTKSEAVEEAARLAQEVVTRATERLRAASQTVTGEVLSGDPVTVILARARSNSADFVFVGSHGASAVERFLLGSVAGTVLPMRLVRSKSCAPKPETRAPAA